jgi:DNA polymerase-3 subunit alpha
MAAAKALAGFTGPEADTLGYAIRKKKDNVLQDMMAKFVPQAAERGVKRDVIDAVFAAFQPFARYGFNKAHATTYGLVAYQTAYLKANYTVEYMASVLTAFRDNTEKVAAAVAECRRLGAAAAGPGEDPCLWGVEGWHSRTRRVIGHEDMAALSLALGPTPVRTPA